MTYFLGVDVGTFESKGVLVDGGGAIVAQAVSPHRMIVPRPGWAEHRPDEDWWGDTVSITRQLLAMSGVDPRAIKAVATSAIGPCMLPLDAAGRPLMNGVLYGVDTRAVAEIAHLTRTIGADTLLARCNSGLTSQSVGPKILWLKNNRPELYAQARMFISATPYITFRLTGEYAMDHFTAAGFTPLYDPARQAWSPDFAEGIVDLAHLPRLLWSSEIAGQVTSQAAAETGLATGTPVVCGTIDAAAEALSVGVTGAGDMMMMYGSTIFIIQITGEQVRDPRLWYAPWLFEGLHASQAGLATSGTLTRWFADQVYRDMPPAEVMPGMAAEAATSPPGANGLVVLPYFSGERTPIHDPRAKGVIFGLDLTHTRADMMRGALEGIGYAVRHIIETYEAVGHGPKRVVAVGGGTKNAVWLGAVSDISGRPQVLREVTTGASLGDAFIAAVATGHATLADIEHWNRPARIQEPQEGVAKALYDRQYAVYRGLYEQTKGLMAELSEIGGDAGVRVALGELDRLIDIAELLADFTATSCIHCRHDSTYFVFYNDRNFERAVHRRYGLGSGVPRPLLGAVLMVPAGRPYGVWRDWIMTFAKPDHLSQLLCDSVALVSFQVPIYAAIIAVSGASGRGLLFGVLGATVLMFVLGRPYGAFLNWVRMLFDLPAGGMRPMSLDS